MGVCGVVDFKKYKCALERRRSSGGEKNNQRWPADNIPFGLIPDIQSRPEKGS